MNTLPATNSIKTIREMLVRSKPQIQMALPKNMTADRMLRIAMTTIQKTPKLIECDPKSLIGAIIEASQLGLEPDGILGQAYLIPFKNNRKNTFEAQLMIGYKGLIVLARNSGQVSSISSHVVYEEDHFEFAFGLNEKCQHVPAKGDRGKAEYVYAVAILKDGGHAFEVMSVKEIEKIRQGSKAANDGPWSTHWDEMARKTVIRRLAKFLPLSPEFQKAAALDELPDAGISQSLTDEALQSPEEASASTAKTLQNKIKTAKKTGKKKALESKPPVIEPDVPIDPDRIEPLSYTEEDFNKVKDYLKNAPVNVLVQASNELNIDPMKSIDDLSFKDCKKLQACINEIIDSKKE
jgi:recombination protein RecT